MPRENSQMSNPNKQNTTTLPVNEKSPAQRTPSIGEKAWEEKTLAPVLSKSPERHAEFTTISGHPIRRLYTEADLSGWNAETDLGYPGDPPYTRGIHSTMHRGRLWTMRQFAGFGAAEDTNQRFRYLLAQGQTGLSTAFDLPTLMGYDSDDHQFARRGHLGHVSGSSRKTRRGLEENFRNAPERHPQGIHRAEGIHLPAG